MKLVLNVCPLTPKAIAEAVRWEMRLFHGVIMKM